MRGPSTAWRAVSWTMAVGAAFDLAFAVAILLLPEPSARVLGLELPADRVYFGLDGILLLLLAALYLLAVVEPVRHQGIVAVSAGGRTLGAVYLVSAWLGGRPAAFLAVGLADLALAAAQTGFLVAARRSTTPSR